MFPNYGYADPPLTFDQRFMDDGECGVKYGKNNEKILRHLVFKLQDDLT